MRVLVTGGAGFIGSHTVDCLLAKGYDVRVLDALLPPVHAGKTLPSYVPVGHVDFILGDVRDRAAWGKALEQVDAVFHLAAYQDYLPDFSTFFHANTVSTALLYELIVEKRMPVRKVIIGSSQAVYGEGRYVCRSCTSSSPGGGSGIRYPQPRGEEQLKAGQWEVLCPACGETMEPQWTDESIGNPHTPYAISKYANELIAEKIGKRYGIPTVCLRYSIVQGARQSFRNAYSGVLRTFVQRICSANRPVCYEDGKQLRDYVSVHDVARANLIALEDERADFEVFNVGGGRQVGVLDYARFIASRAGTSVEPEIPGIYRYGDTRHIFSDITKLGALGWHPMVSLDEIVDEYIAWASGQPDLRDHYPEAEARMKALGVIRKVEGA